MEEKDKQIENEIFEEGEKLYPLSPNSEKCDKECAELYTIENLAQTFYHLKEGKLKERFIELMKRSEYSPFFEGLNYEYGLNNFPQDLPKAFDIYKNAANNTTDSLSMFRLYHIYKNDYEKFNISKRNRVLEKFYLFKCFSFLRYQVLVRKQDLFHRYDIRGELLIHFEEEDNNFTAFEKFIKFLNINYKLYGINQKDISLIDSVINYSLNLNSQKKGQALKQLNSLASENNLEALYKLACLDETPNEISVKEGRFKLLFDKGYYRSFIEYALFLYSQKRYKESLKILKIARENGDIFAGNVYYGILLDSIDFSSLMNEASNSNFKSSELCNLFGILIDDILVENAYGFYEFIFLRKICIKHYNLEKEINECFLDYTKEISNFLIKIVGETDINLKKKLFQKYFVDDLFFQEYHFACSALYIYGIENVLEIDNIKAFDNLNISYKSSNSKSYQRFLFYYFYKVVKRLFEQSKEKQYDQNSIYFVNEQKMKNTEKILFNKFYSSINENYNNLSSSYYYYLSRLYHKKIGNNGDKFLEYAFLEKACESRNDDPTLESIIGIYRRYKAKMIKEKNIEEIKKLKNTDSLGYGDDNDLCPICFTNKRNFIAIPCKHLYCEYCINHITRCALCRSNIAVKYCLK